MSYTQFRAGETLEARKLNEAMRPRIHGGPGILAKTHPNGDVTISSTVRSRGGSTAAAPVVCDFILTTRVDAGIHYAALSIGAPNGVPPSNIFDEITFSPTGTEYVIITADAPSGYVVDWTWDIVGTPPAPLGTVALNGPPTSCAILLYVLSDGTPHRIAPCQVPSVAPVYAFSTPRTGVTDPVEPRYDDWWSWGIAS